MRRLLLAAAVAVATTASGMAQTPGTPIVPDAPIGLAPTVIAPAVQTISDQEFVAQAAAIGKFEQLSSEIALERSLSDVVRQFAERVVQDYTALSEQFVAIARSQGLTVPQTVAGEPAEYLQQVEAATGVDFNRIYVQTQVLALERAVELFEAYVRQGANAELRGFAEQALPILREYLETIRSVQVL
jgi:putative membrane protein